MNLKNYTFSASTPIAELKEALRLVDRLIQRAVKTGSAAAFTAIRDQIPLSILGEEEAGYTKEIMAGLREHSRSSTHFREKYLAGTNSSVSVREALLESKYDNEKDLHLAENTLEWMHSRLLQPHPKFRLRIHPTPNRRNGKLVETIFQSTRGLKMEKEALYKLLRECSPMLEPRTRRTGPCRPQTAAYKLPKKRKNRTWFAMAYEGELVKAKIVRNELVAAIDVARVIGLVKAPLFFGGLDAGVRYCIAADLLEGAQHFDDDGAERTIILDQLCGDGYTASTYMNPIEKDYIKFEELTSNGSVYAEAMVLVYSLDVLFFTGIMRVELVNTIREALKPYNTDIPE